MAANSPASFSLYLVLLCSSGRVSSSASSLAARTATCAPRAFDVSGPHGGSVAVVAHHKSGTEAAFQLLNGLCQLHSHPMSLGGERCCAQNGVTFYSNGRYKHKVDLLADGSAEHMLRSFDAIVHLVRNPLDMLLSGYRYHCQCSREKWLREWGMGGRTDPIRWPPRAAELFERHVPSLPTRWREKRYCQVLRELPAAAALRMEALRTLGAADGVGGMINASATWQVGSGARVLPLCMYHYSPKRSTHAMVIDAWRRVADPLRLPVSMLRLQGVNVTGAVGHGSMVRKLEPSDRAELYKLVHDAMAYAAKASEPDWPAYGLVNHQLPTGTARRAPLPITDGVLAERAPHVPRGEYNCPSEYFGDPGVRLDYPFAV